VLMPFFLQGDAFAIWRAWCFGSSVRVGGLGISKFRVYGFQTLQKPRVLNPKTETQRIRADASRELPHDSRHDTGRQGIHEHDEQVR
jgi:hypothetical protein